MTLRPMWAQDTYVTDKMPQYLFLLVQSEEIVNRYTFIGLLMHLTVPNFAV